MKKSACRPLGGAKLLPLRSAWKAELSTGQVCPNVLSFGGFFGTILTSYALKRYLNAAK